MKLIWAPRAWADLQGQIRYIAQNNPQSALDMAERVRGAADKLPDFPYVGRIGRVVDTRELIVSGTSFILVYAIEENVVFVLCMLHAAQQWPKK